MPHPGRIAAAAPDRSPAYAAGGSPGPARVRHRSPSPPLPLSVGWSHALRCGLCGCLHYIALIPDRGKWKGTGTRNRAVERGATWACGALLTRRGTLGTLCSEGPGGLPGCCWRWRNDTHGSVRVKAEIFSIGTELLLGELTDTNSAWQAARLPALGIELQWISIIGDSLTMLTEGFTRALQRADVILTTGGLGPTQDDLTREAIAAALQETPTVQEEALKELERYFQQRGRSMPAPNIKQAQ